MCQYDFIKSVIETVSDKPLSTALDSVFTNYANVKSHLSEDELIKELTVKPNPDFLVRITSVIRRNVVDRTLYNSLKDTSTVGSFNGELPVEIDLYGNGKVNYVEYGKVPTSKEIATIDDFTYTGLKCTKESVNQFERMINDLKNMALRHHPLLNKQLRYTVSCIGNIIDVKLSVTIHEKEKLITSDPSEIMNSYKAVLESVQSYPKCSV